MFVCKLTQTVLNKSKQTLIILDDDHNRLTALDRQLWSFSETSFIPHDVCISANPETSVNSTAVNHTSAQKTIKNSVAPVILTDTLPSGFDGVVLNLAASPLKLIAQSTQHPDSTMPKNVINTHDDSNGKIHNSKDDKITNDGNDTAIDSLINNSNNKPSNHPNRLLEIIPADAINKQKGREKYKYYRNLGYQLELHTL